MNKYQVEIELPLVVETVVLTVYFEYFPAVAAVIHPVDMCHDSLPEGFSIISSRISYNGEPTVPYPFEDESLIREELATNKDKWT